MKLSKHITLLLSSFMLISLLTQSGCKKDEPTPQDIIKQNLVGSLWRIKSVTVDGVDQTSMYSGMTIQFTATTYSTTQGRVIWPASGSWRFVSTDGSLVRDDGLELTIAVTNTTLDIDLFWPERDIGGGRSNALSGNHTFSFTK